MPQSPRLHPTLFAAPLSLALALGAWGAAASPAGAAPERSGSAPAATYTDDRIHIYAESRSSGKYPRIIIEAGSGLKAFGPEETMVVATNNLEVRITMLDGSPRLTSNNVDGNVHCQVAEGNLYAATDMRCFFLMDAALERTKIDFSAASVATQTVVVPSASPSDRTGPMDAIEFIGGSGPDYVEGSAFADLIDGGPGDDDLFGGLGNDDVYGGVGADTVYGNAGRDTVNGGPGDDYVAGDGDLDGGKAEPDIIIGGPGVDSLDSEDNLADTRVDCENTPGVGAIDFDRGLDLPFNCPVTLAPTAPAITQVSSGSGSLVVDWSPPVFDGNSEIVAYEIRGTPLSTGQRLAKETKGTASSTAFVNLKAGTTYEFTIRAVNAVGSSAWSEPKRGVVTSGPGAPENVTSVFSTFNAAVLSWQKPTAESVKKFEVALRIKDPQGKRWRAWEPLPNGLTSHTSLAVGDLLRLANNRYYQFRVRSVAGNATSDWAASEIRYAAPVKATITKSVISGPIDMTFKLGPRQALETNFDRVVDAYLSFATDATPYEALSITQTGSTYVASFRASAPENSSCYLAVTYLPQGSISGAVTTASSPCQFPR